MSEAVMRAVRFHEYGPPETLTVEEVARPEPGPGEILVRVVAAGVNPVDWKLRQGLLRDYMPLTLPHTPGIDFAGTVEAIGPGVAGFDLGQEVYGRGSGTYAEYTVAVPDGLASKPASLSFDEAASVVLGASTAWAALFEVARIEAGQRVLVHGAAGGVGMYAVQLARWRGAQVVGTCSTTNIDFVRSLGAQTVVDYTAVRFEDAVDGVDAVIDTIGGETQTRSWQVLKRGGVLAAVVGGFSEDEARTHGVRAGAVQGQPSADRLRQIADLIDAGTVWVEVASVFALTDVIRAHGASQTGHGRGRIVVHVSR